MIESEDEDRIDPSFYEYLLKYDPELLEHHMQTVREAIQIDIEFEPFESVGDTRELFWAAANLLHFVEEYQMRTGTTELPPKQQK